MSVRIRLQRHGRKQRPYYYVVVADSRSKRDGKFIERLGSYNPMTNPATIEVDGDKALDWLMKGAEPSDTVRAILSYKGILYRKHLQVGVNKGALTQEEADAKFSTWLEEKSGRIQTKIEGLKSAEGEETRVRLEREAAVAAKRAEALKAQEAEANVDESAEGEEEAAEGEENAGEEATEEPKEEQQMTLPEMFTVGTIVGSHGVSGHIKIKTRFDAVLLNKGTWCFVGIQKKPVPFFVQDVWDGAGHAVVKLQGIDSPEDVAFYRQKEVLIAKEAHHDLEQAEEPLEGPLQWITYELLDQNDRVIGQVTDVFDNTSQWLLQVSDSSDEKNLVPFHHDLLIKEDKVGKRIHLHIPEGLLDL